MSKKRLIINIILTGIVSGLSTYLIGHGIIGIILGILIGQIFFLSLLYNIKFYNVGITAKGISFGNESEDNFVFNIRSVRHDYHSLVAGIGIKKPYPMDLFPMQVDLYVSFTTQNSNNVVKCKENRPFLVRSIGWFPIIYKKDFGKENYHHLTYSSWGIYNLENGPMYDIVIEKHVSYLRHNLEEKILKKVREIIKSDIFIEEFNKALPKKE